MTPGPLGDVAQRQTPRLAQRADAGPELELGDHRASSGSSDVCEALKYRYRCACSSLVAWAPSGCEIRTQRCVDARSARPYDAAIL